LRVVIESRREVCAAAISHIDAAIRIFDPSADIDDIKPKLPPRFQAFKGEVSRLVLNPHPQAGRDTVRSPRKTPGEKNPRTAICATQLGEWNEPQRRHSSKDGRA
jgi:hypothetical protein